MHFIHDFRHITDHISQHVFKEDAQKLGVVSMKPGVTGAQTMLLFIDTLSGAKQLYDQIKVSYQTTFISCDEFRGANVNIGEHVERLSSEVTFYVTLKEHYNPVRFHVAAVTELAKTAAARFGKILRFELIDESGFAANSRLVYSVEYNSVADANDAVLITNPVRGLTLPNGSAEVSTMNISILLTTLDANTCPAHQLRGHWP